MIASTLDQAKAFADNVSKGKQAEGYNKTHLHIYTDEQGAFIYAKPRLKHPQTGDKWLRSISPDSNGNWQMKEPDFNHVYPQGEGKKPLYNLEQLAGSPTEMPIYFFEGEQKADLAKKLGLLATTTGGSSSINQCSYNPIMGRYCLLWHDNDTAGHKWLTELTYLLQGVNCTVTAIDVNRLNLPDKGDIVDWVALQQQASPKLTMAEIKALVEGLPTLPTTANDKPQAGEPAQGEAQSETTLNDEDVDKLIYELASLPPLKYEQQRKAAAEKLGISRLSVLDKLVKKAQDDMDTPTKPPPILETEPHPDPVDGSQVADEIYHIITNHIACEPHTAIASTLWVFFTWVVDASYIAPIAWINAPEKRCGKTQLLTLIGRLCKRALPTTNISPPALYRSIEKYQPTLLIDEADSFFKQNEELRGVLNAGHSRDAPYIYRCQGDDNEPMPFYVYGAKVISGIGNISDTLIDRSISLQLRRKTADEHRYRVRHLDKAITDTLKAKLARWADDNIQAVDACMPALPEAINDRSQDNWEILFKIASLLNEHWQNNCFNACVAISGIEQNEPSINEVLLADINNVFVENRLNRISSVQLVEKLCSDTDLNWATYNRGKPITPRQIAKKLADYGIQSKPLRLGQDVVKGYNKDDFNDTFKRYLSATPSLSVTRLQPNNHRGCKPIPIGYTNKNVTDKKTLQATQDVTCNRVTDRPPQQTENTKSYTNVTANIMENVTNPINDNLTNIGSKNSFGQKRPSLNQQIKRDGVTADLYIGGV